MKRILLTALITIFIGLPSSNGSLTLQINLQNQTFNWLENTESNYRGSDITNPAFGSFGDTINIDSPLPNPSGAIKEVTSFNIGITEDQTEISFIWFLTTVEAGPASLAGTAAAAAAPGILFGDNFTYFSNLRLGTYHLSPTFPHWDTGLTIQVIPEPSTTTAATALLILLLTLHLRRHRRN